MKKTLLIAMVLFFSSVSWAGCDTKRCIGKVKRLYVSSAIYVEMDGDMSTLNCNLVSNVYASLRADHPLRAEVYSALLAGHTSGSDGISVRISEGTNDCKISYVSSIQ